MKKINFPILVSLIAIISLFILTQKEQKTKVSVDNASFYLSVADTDSKRQRGLSDVASMLLNNGMLFVFDDKVIREFWMKDTLIPLQILFIEECTIVDIQEMIVEKDPTKPKKTYRSSVPVDKAIELNAGTIKEDLIGASINELCENP